MICCGACRENARGKGALPSGGRRGGGAGGRAAVRGSTSPSAAPTVELALLRARSSGGTFGLSGVGVWMRPLTPLGEKAPWPSAAPQGQDVEHLQVEGGAGAAGSRVKVARVLLKRGPGFLGA